MHTRNLPFDFGISYIILSGTSKRCVLALYIQKENKKVVLLMNFWCSRSCFFLALTFLLCSAAKDLSLGEGISHVSLVAHEYVFSSSFHFPASRKPVALI